MIELNQIILPQYNENSKNINIELRQKLFENKYYVYELINSSTNFPIYIGKGQRYRCFVHMYANKNNRITNNNLKLFNKILKLRKDNIDIKYRIPFSSNNEKECFEIEEKLISKYGIENLCNIELSNHGIKHTQETKDKIRKKHLGKIVSDETKQKLRDINTGRKMDDEYKKKQSITIKQQYIDGKRTGWNFIRDDAWKKKILEKRVGFKHSVESIEKMKKSQKGKIISIEQREKIRQKLLKPKIILIKKCKGCDKEITQFVKENLKQYIKLFCSKKCSCQYNRELFLEKCCD